MKRTTLEMTPQIRTSSGVLRGFSYQGVNCFRGIPYATAERFKNPVEAEWDGVRDCISFGYVPPQIMPNPIDEELYIPHAFGVPGEDCLNLNIWTPTLDPEEKLPVIVGVFGSSFEGGSAIEMKAYDGTNLAKDGRVVFVSINTRVNMMGFFDLSKFGVQYANSGNRGFEDALCALYWVRENIAKFGGDGSNITLFGIVGGGLRIKYMLQCPAFKGLFHKVFILSGIGDHGRPPESEAFYQFTKAMLRRGGYDENDVTPFETMPLDQLFALYRDTKQAENSRIRCRLSINGWCYGRPEDEGICPDMTDITIVAGNTMTEQSFPVTKMPHGRLSQAEFEEQGRKHFGNDFDKFREMYTSLYPGADERDLMYFGTDHRAAMLDYANVASESGMTIYTYLFAPEFPHKGGIPAFHCSDIGYMLRNIDMIPALYLGDRTEEMMESYSSALISLAHNGTPQNPMTGEWKPYTRENPACMCFGQKIGMLEQDDTEFVRLMEHYPSKKK